MRFSPFPVHFYSPRFRKRFHASLGIPFPGSYFSVNDARFKTFQPYDPALQLDDMQKTVNHRREYCKTGNGLGI